VLTFHELVKEGVGRERWSWLLRPRDRSLKVEAGTVSCFC
jgi:hypothetical protein